MNIINDARIAEYLDWLDYEEHAMPFELSPYTARWLFDNGDAVEYFTALIMLDEETIS